MYIRLVGGIVIEDGNIKQIPTAIGRLVKTGSSFEYVYDYKDHLGNTRASIKRETDMSSPDFYTPLLVQEDHYYPFGMRLGGLSSNSGDKSNKFLYNGKEFEDDINVPPMGFELKF